MNTHHLFAPMVDRVLRLDPYDGPKDVGSVIRDIYAIANTLLQGGGGDHCACLTFPCECTEAFMDDLAQCIAHRHPEAPQPVAEPGDDEL